MHCYVLCAISAYNHFRGTRLIAGTLWHSSTTPPSRLFPVAAIAGMHLELSPAGTRMDAFSNAAAFAGTSWFTADISAGS